MSVSVDIHKGSHIRAGWLAIGPLSNIVGSVRPFNGFTCLLLLVGLILFVAPRAQAGGLKQSVVVSDPNSVPANEASVDTGGRTSTNVYGTDGTAPHPLLTDGNGRLYVNINNNNAAAAPTNPYFNGALTAAATVTSSNGHYYGYDLYNPNVSVCYLQFFSTATPTLGTTVPVNSIPVPGTSRAALTSPMSSLGPTSGGAPISIAATTTPAGSTLCTTGMVVNTWYTNFEPSRATPFAPRQRG